MRNGMRYCAGGNALRKKDACRHTLGSRAEQYFVDRVFQPDCSRKCGAGGNLRKKILHNLVHNPRP
ncbi:hypothetical protein E4K72_21645 [Oxalobacteraceae bacterium OM1]|nr:hypothetical protein E4K72_21645 [Oxalobacteraceae bacterium OM1]